jgi:hypothetical protein
MTRISKLILAISILSPTRKKSELVQVLGQSEASLKLSYGAAEQIWYTVQKKSYCKDGVESIDRNIKDGVESIDRNIKDGVESIDRNIVETSPDFSKSSTGQITSGYVKERWNANGCGEIFPFDVKFAADGVGGTDIYTSSVIGETK